MTLSKETWIKIGAAVLIISLIYFVIKAFNRPKKQKNYVNNRPVIVTPMPQFAASQPSTTSSPTPMVVATQPPIVPTNPAISGQESYNLMLNEEGYQPYSEDSRINNKMEGYDALSPVYFKSDLMG
jgi:hypothetical protein